MSKKIKIPTVEDLFEAGVHFGHGRHGYHPAMDPFIFKKRRDICILDLEKTREKLKQACQFLRKVARKQGKVVFVGLRRQSQDIVEEEAKEAGAMFLTRRWLGGLLTNFSQVAKHMKKLKELREGLSSGEFDYLTKKERLEIEREIEKLEDLVGGIEDLDRLPDALVLASARKAHTAVREAQKTGVSVVALVDTNTDPRNVDFPIPANDDALKSIRILIPTLAQAVKLGYEEGPAISGRYEKALEKAGISLSEARDMGVEELEAVRGIGEKGAREIYEYFH